VDQYELQVCRLPLLSDGFSFRCISKLRRPTLRLVASLFRRFLSFFSLFFQDVGAFGCSQVSLRLLKASRRIHLKSLREIAIIISIECLICHSVITIRTIESDLEIPKKIRAFVIFKLF